ncbi:MAG: flagellar hook-associated protein FlgL [Lachnospiraceae bacterium]|nr:flagellar hook-associated protein FlgL [Lachnospiraceae bacterium]
MRMTNKIMQNNSLYNINNNKVLQDKLSTQMSTQKKITRPSDDPVVAIRALRLRTSVSELTQYYEKNAPDAESWLTVTEKALGTGTEVLTDMVKQATKAANKDLGVEDLTIITQQMKLLRDEYYSTGNVDYAGRYVFTGYRTDTTLSFTSEVEDSSITYDYTSITEPVKIGDFDTINYTDMSAVDGLNKSNYTSYNTVTEQDITNSDIHRIRLSYDDLKDKTIEISYNGVTVTADPATSAENAYREIAAANAANPGTEKIVFVPETGEVLFSDAAYEKLNAAVTTDTEISITYGKDSWKNGDLRPEHYFTCEATVTKNGQTENKVFNKDADVDSQIIEYDVGYNQKIRVNTLASEAFTHGIDRDIDDLEKALASLTEINATVEDLKTLKKNLTEGTPDYETVEQELAAAQKAYDYVRENIHSMFEGTITSVQNYLDQTNVAVTDNGARSSRLDLVSNRLMEQKTTFQTLQSENEDVDISEVAIQLTSTELTYEAALMATGKIMQTSLMNYI